MALSPVIRTTPQASPPVRLVATRLAAPTVTYTPSPDRQDAALRSLVLDVLGAEAPAYGVVIKDLATGRGTSLNADRIYYAASIFKLFVMYEAFRQESLGIFELSDELVMTPYYDAFGLGPRQTELCQVLSVDTALQAMMEISDNAAAVLLQDLVGSSNINQALGALGLEDSRLLTDDLPITAGDVALLVEAIGRGEAVSRPASEQMLELMAREQFDNGLRAGTPRDVTVAHKTGNWTNATHEAGIVFAPAGSYVMVVLSDKDHQTRLIEELSRRVYDYFN
jgi:beta-lactamase class A